MVNTRGIKARLCERGLNVYGLADHVGKSYSATLQKVNGHTSLTLDEAEAWQDYLGIADCDFGYYFMSHSRVS